jgi:hypothetical protein
MWSCNAFGGFGPALFVVLLTMYPAEAKPISYEIDGETYTYESNDRAQIEIARQRINAANAADEARERARAELASSPLVKFFGSPIQTEAAAAEAELRRILAVTVSETTAADRAPPTQATRKKIPGEPPDTSGDPVEGVDRARKPTLAGTPPRHPEQNPSRADVVGEQAGKPAPDTLSHHATPRRPQIVREERANTPKHVGATATAEEARAELIALFRARALAEEQRRLETGSRDPSTRPAELPYQPSEAFTSASAPAAGPRPGLTPVSTGSATHKDVNTSKPEPGAMQPATGPRQAPAAATSAPSRGLCTMTFGLLPGC